MKRGQVFVRGQFANGRWGAIDALDLGDESFRAFVIDRLHAIGAVIGIRADVVEGDEIRYVARPDAKEAE